MGVTFLLLSVVKPEIFMLTVIEEITVKTRKVTIK